MGEVKFMISEAAKKLQVETHVLRYWEEELGLHIGRTEMGHRYYTEDDIQLFLCIQKLKNEGILLRELKTLIPQLTALRRKKTEEKNNAKNIEGTSPSHPDTDKSEHTSPVHGASNRQNHASVALARCTREPNSTNSMESVLAEMTQKGKTAEPTAPVSAKSASAAPIHTNPAKSTPVADAPPVGKTTASATPAKTDKSTASDALTASMAPAKTDKSAVSDTLTVGTTPAMAGKAAASDALTVGATPAVADKAAASDALTADTTPPVADKSAVSDALTASTCESGEIATAPTSGAMTADVIEVTHLEQVRALFGDVITEAITANNHTLEKNISRRVTSSVCREIDLLFQAQEHQEEEHYRKLDTLIRQQQAYRRETAESAPIGAFKKLFT